MDDPETHTPPGIPWLFTARGLIVLLVLALIGIKFSLLEVALLAGTLCVVGAISRLWATYSLRRLVYTRRLSFARAFAGETLLLTTRLTNRKVLPLPWIEAWERFPAALSPEDSSSAWVRWRAETVWLSQGASLWPYQRAAWQHVLVCRRRGVFRLGRTVVRSGDPFSFFEQQQEEVADKPLEVVVYPRVFPLKSPAFPPRHASLDATRARSLITDPTRTVTLREYAVGDSPRLIHWPTTARRNQLHVRVLEPAANLRVSLAVDAGGFAFWDRQQADLYETVLSAIASLAIHLNNRGFATGLFIPAAPPLLVPPGSGTAHVQAMLEGLARLGLSSGPALVPWLMEHLPRPSTVVLAYSEVSRAAQSHVRHLEQAGFDVFPLVAGATSARPASLHGRVVRLTPDCDISAALETWG